MMNIVKVSYTAGIDHIMRVYGETHEIEQIYSTSIPLNEIKMGNMFVISPNSPALFWKLTPKVPHET